VKKGGFIKKLLQSFVYLTSLETVTREREGERERWEREKQFDIMYVER
jgi:hypothetical protein